MNEASATKTEDTNVLPLRQSTEEKSEVQAEGSFQDIMERNRKNRERMKKERDQENAMVLRLYRIKH